MSRTDTASRFIDAAPETIHAALIDHDAMAVWRPPVGMNGKILDFDPTPRGRLRMVLRYDDPARRGKSDDNSDIVESRFVELVPGKSVVEEVMFDSDDPAFAGVMTVTTSLAPTTGGTEIAISRSNVPSGIGKADHLSGLASTLENLDRYCTQAAQ